MIWVGLFLLGALGYLAGGYISARYVWQEDVLARLAGHNYVDQNLILLFVLYFIGQCVTFLAWPLVTPAILVWRASTKGQGK